MKISTGKLMDRLKKTSNLSGFLDRYQDNMITQTVGEYLRAVMEEKGMKAAELVRSTQMGNYVYRVLNDERNVSRNTLITIALGLSMTLEETQTLLRIGQHARLDPRFHRDAAIIYALTSQMDIAKCNDLLYEIGETTL